PLISLFGHFENRLAFPMRTTTIFASLLALGFLGCLLFSAAVIAPKVVPQTEAINALYPNLLQFSAPFVSWAELNHLGWTIGFQVSLIFALFSIPLCLIGIIKKKLGWWLGGLSIANCVAVAALLVIHALSLWVVGQDYGRAWRFQNLRTLAILDQALIIAESEGKSVELPGIADLEFTRTTRTPSLRSWYDQQPELIHLNRLLDQIERPEGKRRLVARGSNLATILHDPHDEEDEKAVEAFMNHAEAAAEREFGDPQEFLDWLEQQEDADWTPVPYYKWEENW
ncbi:MAG: hypothetical protein AAF585_05160, partial [Verrucomicrobiota bacterium]